MTSTYRDFAVLGVDNDQNGKHNIVDGVVREAGETNANVLTSTRKVILEATNTKHGHANQNLK